MRQLLLLLFMPVSMHLMADTSFTVDGFEYTVNTAATGGANTVTLTDELSGTDKVIIPASVTYAGREYRVTSIGEHAFSQSAMTSLTIPNSVTSIPDFAFHKCTKLKELIIEDGTECLSLGHNYYQPGGSRPTYEGLFNDCPLETVYLGRNLYYGKIEYPLGSPFKNKRPIESLTIGNCVTDIAYAAFNGCFIRSLAIPRSVRFFGE